MKLALLGWLLRAATVVLATVGTIGKIEPAYNLLIAITIFWCVMQMCVYAAIMSNKMATTLKECRRITKRWPDARAAYTFCIVMLVILVATGHWWLSLAWAFIWIAAFTLRHEVSKRLTKFGAEASEEKSKKLKNFTKTNKRKRRNNKWVT